MDMKMILFFGDFGVFWRKYRKHLIPAEKAQRKESAEETEKRPIFPGKASLKEEKLKMDQAEAVEASLPAVWRKTRRKTDSRLMVRLMRS